MATPELDVLVVGAGFSGIGTSIALRRAGFGDHRLVEAGDGFGGVRALRHARDRGATAIEVTPEANARYFAEMLARRRRQVFFQPRCGTANSYYVDRHSDVPLRPSTTLETMWRSRRSDLGDYRLSWLSGSGAMHATPAAAVAP